MLLACGLVDLAGHLHAAQAVDVFGDAAVEGLGNALPVFAGFQPALSDPFANPFGSPPPASPPVLPVPPALAAAFDQGSGGGGAAPSSPESTPVTNTGAPVQNPGGQTPVAGTPAQRAAAAIDRLAATLKITRDEAAAGI